MIIEHADSARVELARVAALGDARELAAGLAAAGRVAWVRDLWATRHTRWWARENGAAA